MANVRPNLVLVLAAACGSNNGGKPVDAQIVIPDVGIDAKVWMDAPPPMYDFSCFGMNPGTTAPATIAISGTTDELTMSGATPLGGVAVTAHSTTVLGATMSDMTTGAYTLNVATGGMALAGYLEGDKVSATGTQYRTSFVYPPFPLTMDTMNIPLIMLSTTTFNTVAGIAGQTQNDTANGAFFVAVTDCANMPINGATLTVKQNNMDVGHIFDLGALSSMAAGVNVVFNVPDGATTVTATFMSMTFPAHVMLAHKKNNTDVKNGSVTLTFMRPGP